MKRRYLLPLLFVTLLALFVGLSACDSLLGSSSSGSSSSDDTEEAGENGNGEDEAGNGSGNGNGDLIIRGRLGGIGAASTAGNLGALSADPDWVIVALYWGADFEHPDVATDFFRLMSGEPSELNFNFWEGEEVIAVADDGSFSWSPPDNTRFALFAVDLNDEVDPVRGLVGIRTDADLVWTGPETGYLSGLVDIGSINAVDGDMVWSGGNTAEQLAAAGNLNDLETVREIAFFDDNIAFLKNQLSTGFEITHDGISERDVRIAFFLDGGAGEPDCHDVACLLDGIQPQDYVPDRYEYQVRYFARGTGLTGSTVIEFKPPQDAPWHYDPDDSEDDSGTLTADSFYSGQWESVGSSGYFLGFIGEAPSEDERGSAYPFQESFTESWTVRIDGNEYGITLGGSVTQQSLDADIYPIPVPRLSATRDQEDRLQTVHVKWHRYEGNNQVSEISGAALRRVFPSYSISIDSHGDERYTESIFVDPAEPESTVPVTDEWLLVDDVNDDMNAVWRIGITVNPVGAIIAPVFGWDHDYD